MTTVKRPKPTLAQYEAFERERQEEVFFHLMSPPPSSDAEICKRFQEAWEKSQAKERAFFAIFGVTPDRAAAALYGDGGW